MNPAHNLVLIGPMGAGKTSIGKRLATHLKLEFVDADLRLEQSTGASVPTIFDCEGEAGFRRRETQLIAELTRDRGRLIATGGGVVLSLENRQRLRESGFVVYLQIGIEQQLERLARDRGRPLLDAQDKRRRLQALAEQREPLYRDIADLSFDSSGLTVTEAADRVLALIRAQWQREKAA
jgi:shikimate kinase